MAAPVYSSTAHLSTACTIPVKTKIDQETEIPEEEGNHSKTLTNKKESENHRGTKRRADGDDDDEISLRRIKTEVIPVEEELDMSGIPPKYRQQFEEWQTALTTSSGMMKDIMASGMDLTSLMDGLTEEQKEDARKYVRLHRIIK